MSTWWKRNEEDGQRGGQAREGQKKKKKKKKKRRNGQRGGKTKHMDTGSLALSIHMPSHQMASSHPGDVVSKRTPAPSKSPLPTTSSCSHVGPELELRQKFSVSESKWAFPRAHTHTHTLQSDPRASDNAFIFFFSFLIFPFNVTFWNSGKPGHSFSEVNVIRSCETVKNIFK